MQSGIHFEKSDLPPLTEALRIPAVIRFAQRTVCDGTEGLCMLLRRLAYPCRYSDLIPRYGRPVPEISMIPSEVLDFIFENHNHRVTGWNDVLLNPASLQLYANAVFHKGAPLENCFGFVDGTVRPICRPSEHQRIVYNGHKRIHALKFQSVTLPNGMIANIYGPVGKWPSILVRDVNILFWSLRKSKMVCPQWDVWIVEGVNSGEKIATLNNAMQFWFYIEGKMHDAAMLMGSHLLERLENFAYSPTGSPMCIYGDPAYPLRIQLQGPFRNAVLTPQMEDFNSAMSAVRTSVEWLFGDIIN